MNSCCTPRNGSYAPLSRIMSGVFNDPFFAPFVSGSAPATAALPVDILEDDASITVRASMPGVQKENVVLEIEDGVLTIGAKVEGEKTEQNERYVRRERRVGSASRTISLPDGISADEASAELRDGVLAIRFPKAKKPEPKRVSIN